MKSEFLALNFGYTMTENLSFDGFIKNIISNFKEISDHRESSPATKYEIGNVVLAAFSMFFSQSPSFLEFQRKMKNKNGRSNAESIFGIDEIPSNNQIKNVLDKIPPDLVFPIFQKVFEDLEQAKQLES